MFSYSVGDHAMSVEKQIINYTLKVPLISYDYIVQKYDVDFYSYIEKLMNVVRLLNRKISFYRRKRKILISKLKIIDSIRYLIKSIILNY